MPKGVDMDALYTWMVDQFGEEAAKGWAKWLALDFRSWGRGGWQRVDSARSSCRDGKP